jgi:DNA-binding protein YbaB
MSKLIQALLIFLKYGDIEYPTRCEHDELIVCIDPSTVSEEDKKALEELSFHADVEHFYSYKYGLA